MVKGFQEKMCQRCHHARMKRWADLSDDEKFLAERLPMSFEFSAEERKKHLFCPRCWFEDIDRTTQTV
jgi:hypothetical protein